MRFYSSYLKCYPINFYVQIRFYRSRPSEGFVAPVVAAVQLLDVQAGLLEAAARQAVVVVAELEIADTVGPVWAAAG